MAFIGAILVKNGISNPLILLSLAAMAGYGVLGALTPGRIELGATYLISMRVMPQVAYRYEKIQRVERYAGPWAIVFGTVRFRLKDTWWRSRLPSEGWVSLRLHPDEADLFIELLRERLGSDKQLQTSTQSRR